MKLWRSNKPKTGNTYAVQTGDYVGELFIYVEKVGENYMFLSTPLMTNRSVPVDKFDFALQEGILEFVERVPRYVRNISKAQFKENRKEI